MDNNSIFATYFLGFRTFLNRSCEVDASCVNLFFYLFSLKI